MQSSVLYNSVLVLPVILGEKGWYPWRLSHIISLTEHLDHISFTAPHVWCSED